MNDEDWIFNAPQHYIDLPSAALQSDDEQVDEYFFGMCWLNFVLLFFTFISQYLYFVNCREK